MGNSSSSSVTNKILNKNINSSDIEALNQQVSKFVTEKITNNAQKCSSSSTSVQDQTIGSITSSGAGSDITGINLTQDSSVTISLSCLQTSVNQANISNDIATSIVQSLSSNVSQQALSQALTQANTTSQAGFASTAIAGNTDSSVNVDMTNISETTVNRNLKNVVENFVQNTVKDSDLKQTINASLTVQSQSVKNITATGGGKIGVINLTQKIAVESITKSIQESQSITTVLNKMASTYGLMTNDTTSQTSTAASTAAATTVSKAGGLEDVITSVGNAVSKVFGTIMGLYIGAALILVIICVVVGVFVFKGAGKFASSATGLIPTGTEPESGSEQYGQEYGQFGQPSGQEYGQEQYGQEQYGQPSGQQFGQPSGQPSGQYGGKYNNFSLTSLYNKQFYNRGMLFNSGNLVYRKYSL
jgi:hypothetical protein